MACTLGRRALAPIGTLLNAQTAVQPVTTIQVAHMRATYGAPFGYEKPFPYREKKITVFNELFELTKWRFNENTKIILVDGNIAVGKQEFGKALAKNFDMRYYPPVHDSRAYVRNENQFNCVDINPVLPKSCKFYTLDDFYAETDPTCGRVGKLQMWWFWKQFENYCSACLHLMSTGQGVVLSGSVFKAVAYIEAMRKMNYITPKFYQWMIGHYQNTVCELLPPHLCIYLSAPVDVVRQRIIERNDPREVNSKMLTDEYLQALDDAHRDHFLKRMMRKSEIMEVDWTEKGDDLDIDAITEDIESIELEKADSFSEKFLEWRYFREGDYRSLRKTYQSAIPVRFMLQEIAPVFCPEVTPADDDVDALNYYYVYHAGVFMRPGYVRYHDAMEPDLLPTIKVKSG